MNRLLPIFFLILAAAIAPAQADEKTDFAAACTKAGGAAALCACKADAAQKLLTPELRNLVMLSMRDPQAFTAKAQKGGLSDADSAAWNTYIQQSNRVCMPGY